MAQAPTEPPESIVLQQWSGIKNTVTPERLKLDELEVALNIDLDDVGQAHRRRGYRQVSASRYHSVRDVGGQVYGVKDGDLGIINPDYSFASLVHVGERRVSYARVADTVYFSSGETSGQIVRGAVLPWGVSNDAGEWVSPVLNPTDTLGAVAGKQVTRVPYATEIDWFRGRIYLAAGRTLWATELWQYDYVDRTRNFYYFEHPITMVRAMDDGLFVGTEGGVYFLKGTHSEGLMRSIVLDTGVIAGSSVAATRSRVHPQARQQPVAEAGAIIFLTPVGVCAGFDGGETYNLTQGQTVFPRITTAAALYRDDLGATSYVFTGSSAGDPSANARIGDYAEAEIRRFQGG